MVLLDGVTVKRIRRLCANHKAGMGEERSLADSGIVGFGSVVQIAYILVNALIFAAVFWVKNRILTQGLVDEKKS